jgi:hypothetical protein
MPLLTYEKLQHTTLPTNHYGYSAMHIDALEATEYTLVSIVCDVSGSVAPFRAELEQTLKAIVQACRLSPRADLLMLRLLAFDQMLHELHGFRLLERCPAKGYDGILRIGGSTALYDATENAVSATTDYARRLAAGDYAANAIVFVLTDGMDNASTLTPRAAKEAFERAVTEEALESLVSVLIGVNVQDRTCRTFARMSASRSMSRSARRMPRNWQNWLILSAAASAPSPNRLARAAHRNR